MSYFVNFLLLISRNLSSEFRNFGAIPFVLTRFRCVTFGDISFRYFWRNCIVFLFAKYIISIVHLEFFVDFAIYDVKNVEKNQRLSYKNMIYIIYIYTQNIMYSKIPKYYIRSCIARNSREEVGKQPGGNF